MDFEDDVDLEDVKSGIFDINAELKKIAKGQVDNAGFLLAMLQGEVSPWLLIAVARALGWRYRGRGWEPMPTEADDAEWLSRLLSLPDPRD